MFKKLKSWLEDDTVYTASLLVLIGVISFGLGRLSVTVPETTTNQGAVVLSEVTKPSLTKVPETTATTAEMTPIQTVSDPRTAPFVASKAGTKFHKITCPGAKQIKMENKIYFNSPEEAKAAGYTAAANCPGL